MGKSKKSKLPFVVAPKVNSRIETLGTDLSGKIEIERKGFLSVGEKSFMANVNSQDAVLETVMKLSRSIAKHYSLNQKEAYDEVVMAVTEPSECKYPVYDEFTEEIAQLASLMMVTEQKKRLMMAYCLLLYRVDEELEINDVIDLHEDLVSAIADLYMDEENKSIERLVKEDGDAPLNEEVEEVGKK